MVFSTDVTGVDISDFALISTGNIPDAEIVSVTGSANEYTVLVANATGEGTLRLDLLDNDSIIDGEGIPLGDTGSGNGDYVIGEVYEIVPELPLSVLPVVLVLLAIGTVAIYRKQK